MQIISKIDSTFIGFYSLLIPVVGVLVFVMSGQALALLLIPLLLAIYLPSVLRKPLRRRRVAAAPIPASWRDFLTARSRYYRGLGDEGKKRFELDIVLFLSDNPIAAIGGREVSWQTRLLIAAGVASMLHGRPGWEPPLPDGITVYPGSSFDGNYQVEKGNIAGQAPERGPLLIAEENLHPGIAEAGAGRNVLIHELAHFFDREQRRGGSGILPRSRRGRNDSWSDFWTSEWRRHLEHGSILPDYAALNEAEFFAVACEIFFEQPWRLHDAHPELYQVLQNLFQQDPRQILGNNLD
ncbi:MAG: zinc-dependent peptidase [Candidatus Aminicenantes bacterium]|nr:zinc-dependent peptidase [Candidatus Aminicenantes bacterium]